MNFKNQIGAIVGIAMLFGSAQLSARAGDAQPVTKDERPDRPGKANTPASGATPDRPSISDVKGAVKNFQDQKKEFIRKQRDQRKAVMDDVRSKVRDELQAVKGGDILDNRRKELRDSIEAAKLQAIEQARKLAEEAKEAGKGGGKRGKE